MVLCCLLVSDIAEPVHKPMISYTTIGGTGVCDNPEEYPYSFQTIGDRQQ